MKKKKKEEPLPQIEGYEPELKTIGMLAANLWAVLLMVVAIVVGWFALTGLYPSFSFDMDDPMLMAKNSMWFCILMLLGIVVHELVHGFTWLLLLHKGFRHLSFGLMAGGGFYCHIDVPMTKKPYVISALMPLLLVGLVPWVAGIVTGSLLWMLVGGIYIGAATGDLMIVKAIHNEPADTLIYDHPTLPGCYVYHRKAE